MIRRLYGWPAKEITEELGISIKEVQKVRAINIPYYFTHKQLVKFAVDYVNKHGRWPAHREWINANQLPSPSTVRELYYGWNRWRMSEARIRERTGNAMSELQRDVARHPRLTPKGALALTNATHRRDAMARFSDDRLVKHMTLIDDDKTVGKLYRTTGQCFLRVINSTPEPDGTYAVYALSVPPEMEKARQALAWSFSVTDGWEDFKIGTQT